MPGDEFVPDTQEKPGASTADDRRIILHEGGDLPANLDILGLALAETQDNLFTQSGRLLKIYPVAESQAGSIHRPKGALTLHAVDGAHLVELATRAARHGRYDARSSRYKRCDCPRRVAEAYISRGHWPELPTLAGFVEAPTITLDGRLIDQPGYDKETGIFAAFDKIDGYTRPPLKPTAMQIRKAVELLHDLLSGFPFVGDEDLAATIAGIITGLIRRSLPAAPMMAVTAPTPGTGKTLIAETFAIIATGRRASVLSLGHDDAEAEKRLAGVLLAGDACILLDNIERPLKGDLLCQVATQQFVKLRPLGGSGMVSISTASMMVATGNNLAIVGDLKRRVALIRMDSGQERPEQRTFKHDHLEQVFAIRGKLIRAALMIPLAYLAAGAPAMEGLHPLGGFEQWDRLVRRALVWCGFSDPLKAAEGLREQDPDIEAMRLLFGAWTNEWHGSEKTAAEIVTASLQSMSLPGGGVEYSYPDLRDALQLVCSEKINTRRLGYWLRAHKDRIVDSMQLKQAGFDGHAKITKWQITCG